MQRGSGIGSRSASGSEIYEHSTTQGQIQKIIVSAETIRGNTVTSFLESELASRNSYLQIQATLYNDILRIARNLVETRENIIIESHPFHYIICD